MFDFTAMDEVKRIIEENAYKAGVSLPAVIGHEISRVMNSKEWAWMNTGDDYYKGRHDILRKKREGIGENGELIELKNVPNARQIDNQYRKMVKQKTNYLVGRPFAITTENDLYNRLLSDLFNKNFYRTMKNVATDSLNCGIGWMYVFYDEFGQLSVRKFKPYEIIPEWKDSDHTELDSVIRFYPVEVFDGQYDKIVIKVEYYTTSGIDYFEYSGGVAGSVIPAAPFHQDYINAGGKSYNWEKIPFVAFKYNEDEIPLIAHCKSLQDGLNEILSVFQNNMQEDARNSIIVLVNYDGENLGEFRQKLATYGAVKVRTTDGVAGDVRVLSVEVNSENYKAILDIFRKAITENCMGYDARDDRMSRTPNQMNIQSMYNDIDMDASDMETEYQAALDRLLMFMCIHLKNSGKGDFINERVDFTFNTDMPMDEASKIANVVNSPDLSLETRLSNHPWVDDPAAEMERLKAERADAEEAYKTDLFEPYGVRDSEEDRSEEETT